MVAFKEVFAKMLLYYYVDSTLNSLYDLLDAKVQKCRTDKHTHILPLFLSDPGVPGVRSMGPVVRPSQTDVCET